MMYLLLRNNKQSGPYSLDDLKIMGLKAYDLVWVDGRSAAWRYPCEIDELSAFAPAVEEQPFDRFFKKATPVKAGNNSSLVSNDFVSNDFSGNNFSADPPKPVSEPSTIRETPMGEPSRVPGKRIIYVTMPAGSGQNSSASTVSGRSSRPEPVVVAPAPIQTIHRSESTHIEYEFEDNSAQRLQEDTPVVEFIPRTKQRRSNLILKPLLIGLALLAAGIFIGLSINKDTFSKIRWSAKSPDNGQINHSIAQQLPVPAVKNDPVSVVNKEPRVNDQRVNDQQPDTVATIIGQTSLTKPIGQTNTSEPAVSKGAAERSGKTAAQKAKLVNSNAKSPVLSASKSPGQAKDSVSGALSVVHREAVHRADVVEKPEAGADKDASAKANIASQVSVGANGYTVGTFGGINDLQVTVTNRSAYPLDLVVIEVQYIQANKKIYKTENLYFRGIGAGSALMQEAPKSSRGIKVSYKITMINSKELGLSYSGI